MPGVEAITQALTDARRECRAALLVCLPAVGRDPAWVARAAIAAVGAGADLLEFQTRAPVPPSVALQYAPAFSNAVDVPLILWADAATVSRFGFCLLYTSPSPRDRQKSRMPSSA